MRRIIVATMFAAILGGIGTGTASADRPVVPGCHGESASTNARGALHPFGQVVLVPNTPRNDFGTVGDAVHAIQAGQVDDSIYPNTGN